MNQTYGRHIVAKKCKVQMQKKSPPKQVPNKNAPWILEEEEETGQDEETAAASAAKESGDNDLEVLAANVTRAPLNYVRVHKCTPKDDSYVDISCVPSLKMLARGQCYDGGLLKCPIGVKEGLEYYHSIVWKENNENTFFSELCKLTKISSCNSVGSYEQLCRDPLKVALYLERKIAMSREKFGTRWDGFYISVLIFFDYLFSFRFYALNI